MFLIFQDSWKYGRRVAEFKVLLDNLKSCVRCNLGPIPLMSHNIVGEMQCGLGGYLYVQCQNQDCMAVNLAAYGKQHKPATTNRKSCFVANTKLGVGE